jgi:hypothetical protein
MSLQAGLLRKDRERIHETVLHGQLPASLMPGQLNRELCPSRVGGVHVQHGAQRFNYRDDHYIDTGSVCARQQSTANQRLLFRVLR